jgi:hypothetical protein
MIATNTKVLTSPSAGRFKVIDQNNNVSLIDGHSPFDLAISTIQTACVIIDLHEEKYVKNRYGRVSRIDKDTGDIYYSIPREGDRIDDHSEIKGDKLEFYPYPEIDPFHDE